MDSKIQTDGQIILTGYQIVCFGDRLVSQYHNFSYDAKNQTWTRTQLENGPSIITIDNQTIPIPDFYETCNKLRLEDHVHIEFQLNVLPMVKLKYYSLVCDLFTGEWKCANLYAEFMNKIQNVIIEQQNQRITKLETI